MLECTNNKHSIAKKYDYIYAHNKHAMKSRQFYMGFIYNFDGYFTLLGYNACYYTTDILTSF